MGRRQGQIVKRGHNIWQVRLFLGADEQGRHWQHQTVRGPKREAEALLNQWIQDRNRGVLAKPTHETLSAYLDRWLRDAARGRLRQRTYVEYEKLLTRYVRPTLGPRPVNALTPLDLQGLYTELQAKGLGPRTIRYVHAVLHVAFKDAVSWRLLAINPGDGVKLLRVPKPDVKALSSEQAAVFQAAADTDPLGLVLTFGLATGMRPSEYLGLQWQDVDLKAGTATVRRVIVQRAGPRHYAEPKTKNGRRTVPLPATLTVRLREHYLASPFKAPTDPVFAGEKGQPLDEHSTVRRHFKAILKQVGLPTTVRLYDLRHTCATLLLGADENTKVVSERLGHGSSAFTMDTYQHVQPTMQHRAAAKLDAILFGGDGARK